VIVLGGARAYDYTGSNPWTQESFLRAIHSYNPVTDRWAQVGELQQPQAYAATALLPDGRLWLTGGGAGADMAKAWADTWFITARALQP
jgi:N-acetylneuraminic acid mutarotase